MEGAQGQEVDHSDVLGRRIGAGLLDLLTLVPVFIIMALLFGESETGDGNFEVRLEGGSFLAFFAITLVYYFVCETLWQQTLGKKLLGISVVGEQGKPTAGQVMTRTLLRIIDILPALYLIGFISLLATGERRQRLGDLAAHTRVVRTPD